ncbi:MAG: arylesterase [Planctomycetes bacterium]|nr:arylesterase [Planctomycetota bacterium]
MRTVLGVLLLLVASFGCGRDDAVELSTSSESDDSARKVLVCLGDSITAGYGLDPDEAYPALLQQKIDDAGLPWRVIAAGVSGDTTAGGLRRLDWAYRSGVDAVLIALGGNDGLRGVDPRTVKANLIAIAEATRAKNPDARIVLAGMKSPPNMGVTFTSAFEDVFEEAADEADAVFIPFLLEGVGGMRLLNQADGIHPTAEGQKILAEHLWETLEDVLGE